MTDLGAAVHDPPSTTTLGSLDWEPGDLAPPLLRPRVIADPTRRYLDYISRVPLLTRDEEVRLGRVIRTGQVAEEELRLGGASIADSRREELEGAITKARAASEAFVMANLRLVVSIARRHSHGRMPLLDMVQEGNLGLLHAVEKFDYRKGFKFSTYATWWIRQAVMRAEPEARTIRLPGPAASLLRRAQRVTIEMEGELGRSPTTEELAEQLDVSADRLSAVLVHRGAPVSFNDPVGGGEDLRIGDALADPSVSSIEDETMRAAVPAQLARVLDLLDERERHVITQRYGLGDRAPADHASIAVVLGISRERSRQLEARALAKLQHPSARQRIERESTTD